MSPSPAKLPSQIIAVGRAVGDFTLKSGVTTKGKPYQLVIGRMVSGSTFVNLTESVPAGQTPILPLDGEEVRACVVPSYKNDGLLALDCVLLRPEIASSAKK